MSSLPVDMNQFEATVQHYRENLSALRDVEGALRQVETQRNNIVAQRDLLLVALGTLGEAVINMVRQHITPGLPDDVAPDVALNYDATGAAVAGN